MSSETTTLNDNLVKIDNLINGLNFLLEEVETRKSQILQGIDVNGKIREEIDSHSFRSNIYDMICGTYGDKLYREIAFRVMEKIDNDIEAFINDRVDKALKNSTANNL